MVIGHSFGGGVATKLAHRYPDRVGYLVLLNSVGGVTDRPIWLWPFHLARELLPPREGIDMLLAMRHDLVDNVVHHPVGLVRVGHLARTVDLREELADLRRRDLPVLALTTERDDVIPQQAFSARVGRSAPTARCSVGATRGCSPTPTRSTRCSAT